MVKCWILNLNVNDVQSITANHFNYAGDIGAMHFFLLLNTCIEDINNITLEEINIVHAAILFKGHLKDKTLAQSYRTISTCPLIAKGLDMFVRDLNLDKWKEDQSEVQFLGEGSSHELAALLLTETIQHSLFNLKQPIFVIYLDAKSAFDRVLRKLLVRNLYHAGTAGQELLLINHRLNERKTIVEWAGNLMGPIQDQLGLEQGGVNSGDFYKVFGKSQLQMAQDSCLGIPLAKNLIISAIGQADDTLHVSNKIHNIQNLLELSNSFCCKYNVELCPEKNQAPGICSKETR